MVEFFDITSCKARGCIRNERGKCRLDLLPIVKFADSMQFFRSSDTCQVRAQIGVYKTIKLIGND